MGLFDFVADLADIGKDIILLPVEIGKATVEFAADINETIAQDIKNKVSGTPDKPIRTSYDIRDEADKIIKTANESFYNAKQGLMSSWYSTSKEAERVAEKRKKVYQLLGQATSTALVRLPDQPIELRYPSNTPYVDSSFDVGTFFGLLGVGSRMEAAEEYLQQSKEYRADVRSLINDVNSLKRTVLNVADAQKEEMAILETIQAAYQTRSKDVLKQSAKMLHEISLICVQEMSTNTDTKYNDLIQHLRSIWC